MLYTYVGIRTQHTLTYVVYVCDLLGWYSTRVISHGIFTHLNIWVHLFAPRPNPNPTPKPNPPSATFSLLSPSVVATICDSLNSFSFAFWLWNQQLVPVAVSFLAFSFSSAALIFNVITCKFVCFIPEQLFKSPTHICWLFLCAFLNSAASFWGLSKNI